MEKLAKSMNLPMISGADGSLNRYLQEIRKFPMLAPEAKAGKSMATRKPHIS
jgi:hypothetical protein